MSKAMSAAVALPDRERFRRFPPGMNEKVATPFEVSPRDWLPIILRAVDADPSDEDESDLCRAVNAKCAEITALVMQFRHPAAEEAHVQGLLRRKYEFACEVLGIRLAKGDAGAERQALLESISSGGDYS
jgi:hypothetical protein